MLLLRAAVPSVASKNGSMAATAAWSSCAEGKSVSWARPYPPWPCKVGLQRVDQLPQRVGTLPVRNKDLGKRGVYHMGLFHGPLAMTLS